jgi:hypothetical protein
MVDVITFTVLPNTNFHFVFALRESSGTYDHEILTNYGHALNSFRTDVYQHAVSCKHIGFSAHFQIEMGGTDIELSYQAARRYGWSSFNSYRESRIVCYDVRGLNVCTGYPRSRGACFGRAEPRGRYHAGRLPTRQEIVWDSSCFKRESNICVPRSEKPRP